MIRERRKRQGAAGRHQRYAQEYARLATYFGDLVKSDDCEHCGVVTTDLHRHHETYDLPLEVEWVCRRTWSRHSCSTLRTIERHGS